MRKKSDIDYQRVFPDISSLANIWNKSDEKSDKEESKSNDCATYSDNICFSYKSCVIEERNISILIIL